MFGIGKLFRIILFLINGIAVLSEDRFLRRIGWLSKSNVLNTNNNQFNDLGVKGLESDSLKIKIVNLINAIRTLLRVPLIGINIGVIVYEIILG